MKGVIVCLLLLSISLIECAIEFGKNITEAEFPGYDGWYNNLARPDSGAIDRPLLRRWPAAYEDGTYLPAGSDRPNPFDLSDKLLSGAIGSASRTGKNALLVFFGQQVVEEILDAQRPACPPEYFNIPIPEGHKFRATHTEMPLLRTRFDQKTGFNPNNPRQQLNEITPYLDGGLIYGITKQWSDQLRTYSNGTIDPNGKLAYSHGGLFPEYNNHRLPMANPPPPFYHAKYIKNHETEKVSRFFKLGNPRGNENTFLLTFGILWFRWHNVIAEAIKNKHDDWSSERIFNEARKWVIASQQHIVFYEWLPSWINSNQIPAYKRYDPSIDPQIDQFFQSAAFRFGHTLVTPGVYLRDYNRNGCNHMFKDVLGTNAVRTCNAFWRPQEAIMTKYNSTEFVDIDRLLMGMAYQLCEEEDHKIVEDLRENVFGPLEFPRRDLMAINIQRGRDHGLPDFNSARRAYGLEPVNFDHFKQFKIDNEVLTDLRTLYKNNSNNIDPWVGGILETVDGPGQLFEAVILDQFRRIRDGDRFWYENTANNLFTADEIKSIKKLTLFDIITNVTKIRSDDIQENVFRVPFKPVTGNCTKFMQTKICKENNRTFPCYHLRILDAEALNETCSDGSSYDYFSNSEISFIASFTALGAFVVGVFSIIFLLGNKKHPQSTFTKTPPDMEGDIFTAKQYLGQKSDRDVIVNLNNNERSIIIELMSNDQVDKINCSGVITGTKILDMPWFVITPQNSYDRVLIFMSDRIRNQFEIKYTALVKKSGGDNRNQEKMFKSVTIVTQELRQTFVEIFFKTAVAQVFGESHDKKTLKKIGPHADKIITIQLSLNEFANLFKLPPKTDFVKKLFNLLDTNNDNFISFPEVQQLLTTLNGTPTDKALLLYKMYSNNGNMSRNSFDKMMKSFLEISKSSIDDVVFNETIQSLLERHNLQHKASLTFDNFAKIMGENVKELDNTALPSTYFNKQTGKTETKFRFIRTIEQKSKKIFWWSLYTLVLWAIFLERAYYYSVEREHSGLRQIAGYGVTVTRGAASAMMFTYSSLLVTMCRNMLTMLRDTPANNYFPFDLSIDFHKYIAYWALFFTVMHSVGHGINFYHISTQTADDLSCLFRNYFHGTHEFPKFHYWCWQTMTGFTGIILVILTTVIFVFAQPMVRRKSYNYFWNTHLLYPLFFIFMILHGSGRLIQEPFFYYFFLGPVILFAIDQIISLSRKKVEIQVLEATILPSEVTMLKFRRPYEFNYKSGQWVRIACLSLNNNEYHPFTLSSSPDETDLSVHIRAVGPWTQNIRNIYNDALKRGGPLPHLYLDGPFGEGHQDWHRYEVPILIGGGIGVTPFASILKDTLFRANIKQIRCKKVYFIWVSKSQKQFEWLQNLIREIESNDQNKVIETHIYITEFLNIDLRTIMLYVFENHYKKFANKSLFTNLQADTHFGRPDFYKFFKNVNNEHSESNIGVFSCGNPAMISSVDEACIKINKSKHGALFQHLHQTF